MAASNGAGQSNSQCLLWSWPILTIKVVHIWLSKTKIGASSQEIRQYVYQKYVKKKFVKDPNEADPLTAYKQNGMKLPEA